MSVTILVGDAIEKLRELPSESVHVCVTSPPYYGLRDYGHAGQMGMEPTLAEYIANMVAVFREVRRVLRDDGTLWLNIGDSYAGSWAGNSMRPDGGTQRAGGPGMQPLKDGRYAERNGYVPDGAKPKDMMMVPERLALALQDDGWWVRSRIIWHKKSCMPESVTDRPTKSHEHIWLLAKSERYFYDSKAASEASCDPEGSAKRYASDFGGAKADDRIAQGLVTTPSGKRDFDGTRNWRDVWSLGPEPFKDAHFATFPTEIPRRAIVAGCPVGGTVLDPFLGSGTTALVADQLQRNAIGIELNPAYAEMARKRVLGDSPLFAEVA